MKLKYLLILSGLLFCISCKQKEKKPATPLRDAMVMDTLNKKTAFKEIKFDHKKDVVCGMPISAGVSDTVMYKAKMYGFCAKECKDEFLKNPKQYLTAKN